MSRHGSDAGNRILFAPRALNELAAGFDEMAALIAVTLGPMRGTILSARSPGSVERLSDAGTIARRVVELPGRGRNTGAMIARHLAWRMHEQFGDGAATAVVLARAMVSGAVRRIAAGVDPAAIRDELELALPGALSALAAESSPIGGLEALQGIATGVTGDPELGAVLGEIVDLLGCDAMLTVEEYPVPYLDREYVEGAAWRAHPAARAMIPEGQREVALDNPLIVLADQQLATVGDVQPALELALQAAPRRPLLVVANKIADQALATLRANVDRGTVMAVAAILSSSGAAQTDDLGDLAALSGGTALGEMLGRPPARTRREDLGTARKVTLSRDRLTIVDGAGDPAAVVERAAMLRRRMTNLAPTSEEWRRLQGRVARLSGGGVILKIGAHSGTELAERRAQAEKAFRVLTGALADGVVPGGGAAYLGCVPKLRALRERCADPEKHQGVDLLLAALEAPFIQLARNHGVIHPPLALQAVRSLGCGYGLDVRRGEYVDMRERQILDSLRITRGALELAVSSAISVFTTGVVIVPRAGKRERRVEP